MTWGEFKAAVEARGVTDDAPIDFAPDCWGGVNLFVGDGVAELRIDANDPTED